jgi:hypothetical protein
VAFYEIIKVVFLLQLLPGIAKVGILYCRHTGTTGSPRRLELDYRKRLLSMSAYVSFFALLAFFWRWMHNAGYLTVIVLDV